MVVCLYAEGSLVDRKNILGGVNYYKVCIWMVSTC
jgi:hypothetical protein